MSVVNPLERVQTPRLTRMVKFVAVGSVGAVIDILLTVGLLSQTHYLIANAAGFVVAVSFNFVGNWSFTYNRPDGSLPKQYVSYVALHSATFGLRAVTITALVELAGAPATAATLVGIGLAAATNFLGVETLLGGAGELRFDFVETVNQIAHAVYSSRLRDLLHYTGLYNPIFSLYTRGLAVVYPAPERSIHVNGATATIKTDGAVETVSVLHTLEKERDILAEFVEAVEDDDHVVDVGANLGVFSALARDVGADVTAVEPHPPTAQRARQNLDEDARVVEAALGAEYGLVQLAVEQDSVGTQRPEITEEGEWTVDLLPGDRLRAPDVLKIDVEGAELSVLDGLKHTLEKRGPHTIIVEAHSDNSAGAVVKRLGKAGYAVEILRTGSETYLKATDDPRGEDLDLTGDTND
jgi:FkbM family methyltransferase